MGDFETRSTSSDKDGSAEPEAANDLRLVRASLQQHVPSVDELLQRLQVIPRVLRVQNRRLGGPLGEHALEDLAQDVFVVIWRKRDVYDGRRPLEAWVYRICMYQLMNAVRRGARRSTIELHPTHLETEPTEGVDYEELQQVLEKLPSDAASTVHLKHFEALTFDEIAGRLSIPSATAKTRYYRGMRELRRLLEERRQATDDPVPLPGLPGDEEGGA